MSPIYSREQSVSKRRNLLKEINAFERLPQVNQRKLIRMLAWQPGMSENVFNLYHFLQTFWGLWKVNEIPDVFQPYNSLRNNEDVLYLLNSGDEFNFVIPNIPMVA